MYVNVIARTAQSMSEAICFSKIRLLRLKKISWLAMTIFFFCMAAHASTGAEDVSDRHYYPQIRELIALSEKSVDLGLAEIAVSEDLKDPVSVVLEDLISAAKRGVRVRLFLNTFTSSQHEHSLFLREDKLDYLRKQGIEAHFVQPGYRLEDQLLIADGARVLESSMPWTKKMFEEGLGSATLIYSEPLAQKKQMRLEMLPLWDVETRRTEMAEGRIPVPLYLMHEMRYFPAMAQKDDGDALKIYLKLLRLFFGSQAVEFTANFADLSQEIPADEFFDEGTVRFQVLKTLKRLAEEYDLIEIIEEEPDQARIRLTLPTGLEPAVAVPPAFFHENFAKQLPPNAIYAYFVILYRSQSSGESPVWLGSGPNVEQDFPMPQERFRTGVQEIRRHNLVEVFPFPVRQGEKYTVPAARENRYLVNPVPTLSERLAMWSRLRDQYGEDIFLSAREMADLLGEPEDPKVVTAYMQILREFPLEDVRSLTQHVAELKRDSSPAMLDYVRTLLQHEPDPNYQLATP